MLRDLASKQDDEKSLKNIVDKASTVYEKHSESPKIALVYLNVLYLLASHQRFERSLKITESKAATVYEKHSESPKIALVYLNVLLFISLTSKI